MRAAPRRLDAGHPESLAARFPDDREAIEMGLESYLAVCTAAAADSRRLGHLAVLDGTRMEITDEDVATLRIFASRAAAELERRAQAAELAASRAQVVEAAEAPSAAAWAATSTTAPSSACSPCPTCCGSPAGAIPEGDPASACWTARRRSSSAPTPTCASSRAASTRSPWPSAGCRPPSPRWPPAVPT